MESAAMSLASGREGFILTRQQYDGRDGVDFSYWLKDNSAAFNVTIKGQEVVFFVFDDDVPEIQSLLHDLQGWRLADLPLKELEQRGVHGLYCQSLAVQRQVIERLTRAHIGMMEEDIRGVDRYLMERFIQAGARAVMTEQGMRLQPVDVKPPLKMLSLDIETTMRADHIFSIGFYADDFRQVVMIGEPPAETEGQPADDWLVYVPDERQLLKAFERITREYDPDIFIGWNVVGFDFRVIYERARLLGVRLSLGRDNSPLNVMRSGQGKWFCRIPGRVVIDGIDTLKGATFQFESFSLEYVANHLLERGKLLGHQVDDGLNRGEEIQQTYRDNPRLLAEYNLEDCKLVWDIFEKAQLLHYLVERGRLTGLALDKIGGSAAAFDNQYLPRLHRKGYVARVYASGADMGAPGGFVMDSVPGLFEHVLVLDFKSLYPSIILTFMVDPYGLAQGTGTEVPPECLIPGFNNGVFDRRDSILPSIIETLWSARDQAKAEQNAPLSQAIKIIMNSFYGVLGSNVCRFFDSRLSGSITLRGHEILNRTKEQIEQAFGHKVIYGDTDSVFVWLGNDFPADQAEAEGKRLATELNNWWRQNLRERFDIDCHLELEFETHYQRFLMPTMRHSDKGTKKRYAGIQYQPDGSHRMVFKGLENVRSDWTPLARRVQQELYEKVFTDQPYQEYLQAVLKDLRAGLLDDELVYRKRLRRPLADYQKNKPPQIQAAHKLCEQLAKEGKPDQISAGTYIEYVITVNGPEPARYRTSAIDYQHYADKQLMPVIDTILVFLNQDFESLATPQFQLF
ncbi:DNA polymerase II [Aliamphritea spongicola]|uniref:DNA polymerase II n=1 Tax=Aliamphritea spongicola TaxID=707589 RepID=UPI001FAF898D|nr:DNA polymerase II [Aliamphritea spongicola]